MYSQRPIRIPCCTRMENPPILNRIFYAQMACQSTVTIVDKNGKSVDATRLMALMGMGIKCGDTVTVRIEGADEDTAAPAMEKFFSEHL